MQGAPVGRDVALGMFVASWARAEFCPVNIIEDGTLELHCRYTPNDALEGAFGRWRAHVVGCIGWALPLLFGERHKPFAASWTMRFMADWD
jgi:hypothetical protein